MAATKDNSFLRRYIPAYAQNPFKLAWMLLRHPKPAARSALFFAGGGLLFSPIDKLLLSKERNILKSASPPEKPVLLVCGPPRSGTTLLVQYLINTLDVSYINNLSSLFPRSSLTINKLFAKWVRPRAGDYNAYYGKSVGFAGNNDGLFLWDRWLGHERDRATTELMPNTDQDLSGYFGALEQQYGLPVVNKANRLISAAHLISPILPTAKFLFIWRNPIMLAQSLLVARGQLTGGPLKPYGLHDSSNPSQDPVEDVCRQVEFLHTIIDAQLKLLGQDRALVVDYSDFCTSPTVLLDQIRNNWGIDLPTRRVNTKDEQFTESGSVKIPESQFNRFKERLSYLRTPGPA